MSTNDGFDQSAAWLLDENMIDALVEGDEVPAGLAPLAVFAQRVVAIGDEPAPAMSAELAVLVATTGSGGEAIELTAARGHRRLPLVAKVAIAGALATVATAGAAAANVLPERVNDAVRSVVEAVSPIEFEERPNEPAPFDPDEHDPPDEPQTTVPMTSTTVASGVPLPTDPTTGPSGNGPGASSGTTATPGSPGTTHQGGPPPVTPTHPAPKPKPTTPPATSPTPTEPEKPHPTHPTQPEHPAQPEHPTHPEKPEHPASPESSAPESPPGQDKPDKQD